VITFIDTPGHEAFTAMRNRGAKVADIAILVVAADDGVKPQTVEAYRIIEAAKLPFIVAINKIDKPEANLDKTKQELSTQLNIIPEDWGGKIVCVPLSAKSGDGVNELLDMILLVAEVGAETRKADPSVAAVGTIIESHLDKGEGPIATVLVQNGTLRIGDPISFNGIACGKVRSLKDHLGAIVKVAAPGTPVKLNGLKFVPVVGDVLEVAEGERVKQRLHSSLPTASISNSEEEENTGLSTYKRHNLFEAVLEFATDNREKTKECWHKRNKSKLVVEHHNKNTGTNNNKHTSNKLHQRL
jgi:translation initiation factor IF-2